MKVIPLPRRLDVRKSPRRLARKPKALVIELRPKPNPTAPAEAYRLYLEASAIDENEPDRARAIYERALRLDPNLSIAWTNLGNLHYRAKHKASAESHYRRALELDPNQPEALYNLGYVVHEHNKDPSQALSYYERAIANDPSFADAHYNAAIACDELGLYDRAISHWRAYVKLEPTGEWADTARAKLQLRATSRGASIGLRLVK